MLDFVVLLATERWPVIFVADFLRYAIPASSLAFLLVLFSGRLASRRLQKRRATRIDVTREILHSFMTVFIFSLVGLLIVIGEEYGVFSIRGGAISAINFLGSLALIILMHDAYFYWSHRMMHHKRLFALFHRTHHLSRAPTPFTAYSFAPLEAVVEAAFLPIYLLFVPMHMFVIGAFLVHMIVRNVIAHAGFELFPRHWLNWPLLRHITASSHHDMHHQHFNCNYGFYFTWWDRWMGTEHPEYRARFEQATTGGSRTKSTANQLVILLVTLSLLGTSEPTQADTACDIEGRWVTQGFSAVVEIDIAEVDESLTGTILWVADPTEQALVGQNLFSDFKRESCIWKAGKVLDPASNRRYRGTIERMESGEVQLKGCFGPFCQNQTWRAYGDVLISLPEAVE